MVDPISIAMAGAGLVKSFMDQASANRTAKANQAAQQQALAFQQQNLANALGEARLVQQQRQQGAGGLRLDQFGNATYYDPTSGRWITSYAPAQQELIKGGQERQRRAQVRGAQASEDFDRLRGEYLYRKPKTEAESYAEIVNLINQAMGTGERQLNTLMNRFDIRTAGNIPKLVQRDRGPTPGQQLAETMLRARGAALEESTKRRQAHGAEYLPALKQFEETANYMAPVDPTGAGILGMEQAGRSEMASNLGDYGKLLASIYATGGQGVQSAYSGQNVAAGLGLKAAGMGPQPNDFFKFAGMFTDKGKATGGGTVGKTTGATYSGDDGIGSTGQSSINDSPFGLVGPKYKVDAYGDVGTNMGDWWPTF